MCIKPQSDFHVLLMTLALVNININNDIGTLSKDIFIPAVCTFSTLKMINVLCEI